MFWLVINKSCQRQTNGGLELNVSNANTQLPVRPSIPLREERTTARKVPGREMSRTKFSEHENKTSQFHV